MPDVAVRQGQEGSRWYNERPSSDQVAAWFGEVPLHEGMKHADYIGGVVLIQSKEKSKDVVGFNAAGGPNIVDREDLVFVPYVKVETRVAYFWRWVELHDGWVGEISPVLPIGADTLGLPPGFFRYAAKDPKDRTVMFVGCCMQMKVWDSTRHADGDMQIVRRPAPGTKITATASKWDVDENALMKAETGAVGRALGMGGMLVVPGSGVATAEDMQEALYGPPAGATPEGAALPDTPAAMSDEELRGRATQLVTDLDAIDPARAERFREWATARKLILAEAQGAVLRGAIKKLELALADARG